MKGPISLMDQADFILDMSFPASPIEAGLIDTDGSAHDIVPAGTYAYVTDSSKGLQIFDISDISPPIGIGSLDQIISAFDVFVVDSTAYVKDFTLNSCHAPVSGKSDRATSHYIPVE